MSNDSMKNETQLDGPTVEDFNIVVIIWIIGIAVSTLCLILQIVLFVVMKKIRKIDQKILTQMTVARILNTFIELMMSLSLFNAYTKDLTFAMYLQTDVVLVCWMFVYTKHLYDKVVLVFVVQEWNFILLSVLIWALTIPLGVLCPVFLTINYYFEFYKAYAWLKFGVLFVNLLFFCRIFYVIVNKWTKSSKTLTDIIKTCIISFILVCVTSLQVLLTDISSYVDASPIMSDIFCIINSFQVVAVTIIFLILVKNCKE